MYIYIERERKREKEKTLILHRLRKVHWTFFFGPPSGGTSKHTARPWWGQRGAPPGAPTSLRVVQGCEAEALAKDNSRSLWHNTYIYIYIYFNNSLSIHILINLL